MECRLRPLSHPQLDTLVVRDGPLAIGRHEPPFSGYRPELIERLSRRHARVFVEGGRVYVVDLGSSNGTTLNGDAVTQVPQAVAAGDTLTFAGTLRYRVEAITAPTDELTRPATQAEVLLVLTPAKPESPLENLVVSWFPFLISKQDEVFARFKSLAPAEVDFLSRRHAHVFRRDGRVWLEDLGSTNGTFLNGERLDEHAREIGTGDTVAFGGDFFVYRVTVNRKDGPVAERTRQYSALTADARPAPPGSTPVLADVAKPGESQALAAAPAAPPGLDDDPAMAFDGKTTFISTATSFLDIFCAEPAKPEAAPASTEQATTPEVEPAAGGKKRNASGSRAMRSLKELREALGATSGISRRRLYWSGGVIGAALLTWVAWSILRGDAGAVVDLYAAGKYEASARAGAAYLKRHGAIEPAVAETTVRALLKATVPDWLARLEAKDFGGAEAQLAHAAELAGDVPRALGLIDVLRRVTQLERYIDKRGGDGGAIEVFARDNPLQATVAVWDRSKDDDQRQMALLLDTVPSFQAQHQRTYSQLRQLREEAATYLASARALEGRIAEALGAGDAVGLSQLIDQFAEKYPRASDVRQLRADAARAAEWFEAGRSGDFGERLALSQRLTFSLPVFETWFAQTRSREMPTGEEAERFASALQRWGEGDHEGAQHMLATLASSAWAAQAKAIAERNSQVLAALAKAQAARGRADYTDALLALYERLDPSRDRHLLAQIDPDLRAVRDREMARAVQAASSARHAWNAYLREGGIQGGDRLNESVSSRFREQAQRLALSFEQIGRVSALHLRWKVPPEAETEALAQEIRREMDLQRRSLEDLKRVLGVQAVTAKLALLGGEGS